MDRTLINGGFWERATFTVPKDVSDERVQSYADKYTAKGGKAFEAQGFTVLKVTTPRVSLSHLVTEADRRRYDIYFFLKRKPVEVRVEVPEILHPHMLAKGYRQN
ncbi:hypothetical protein LCGC14_1455460 [marine sediment metagenome]|uniref:Uncharacterized protein n=1 Tax=marine sediment metagenome TaxID=412755 RepID=A0A0F9MII2_9ZZZZ